MQALLYYKWKRFGGWKIPKGIKTPDVIVHILSCSKLGCPYYCPFL